MAAKLKIGGAWSGVMEVEVELETWTVRMLREEVASRSNCGPELINLICGGKVLKDGDGSQKLTHLGLKNNSKILATRVSLDQTNALNRTKEICMAEEERSARLARIKAAAAVLAKRHVDGSLPVEDFNIELEDQSGQKVHLGSETDQKAAMMGLMLHTNAKQLIRKQNYKDALEVLEMGEEAFSLCNPKVMELIDNVPILQIDMVWCYFLLRDISWLSVAGLRLAKARQGIERAHGKDSSRLRLLQAGCHPEIALHLRLELLEGVVAYHSGQLEKSRKALTAAQDNFAKLQVPDEALSLIMSMGYKENDAKRALRMTNHEVATAIEFLIHETEKRVKKQEEDIRRRNEIKEQKRYGETPLRKAVDLQRLEKLVSIGYEKELAAEALRRNENDFQMALDDLINPDTNSVILLDIESRKRKRQQKKADSAIDELVSMGFERGKAVAAVQACGTLERAESFLLAQLDSAPLDSNSSPSEPNHADSSVTDAAGSVSLSNEGSNAGPSSAADQVEERDVEMEDELAEELRDGDVYSDYDIDVSKEGEALNEYLSLLASTSNSEAASSSQ